MDRTKHLSPMRFAKGLSAIEPGRFTPLNLEMVVKLLKLLQGAFGRSFQMRLGSVSNQADFLSFRRRRLATSVPARAVQPV
jgi:hypothetical protein